jgi:hypothetical protein
MSSPLFVDSKEEGLLLVFRSIDHAQRYIEAIDVRNGVYGSAYDVDGHVYRIEVVSPRRFWQSARVVLQRVSDAVLQEELRRRLIDSLAKRGRNREALEAAGLQELIEIAIKYSLP